MGYTLKIGEPRILRCEEEGTIRLEIEEITLSNAPDFHEYARRTNKRSPSYTGWADFCEEAGIVELFFGSGWDKNAKQYADCPEYFHRERPIINEHPGISPITEKDLAFIVGARMKREAMNGGRLPGFIERNEQGDVFDPVLARLIWLEFWFKWALENCKSPCMSNS